MSGDVDFLSLDDVRAARERIAPHVRVTPTVRWKDDLWLKLEMLQMGGSFKARGACNRVFAAGEAQLAHGVVTRVGRQPRARRRLRGTRRAVPSTIYLPERAPQSTERRLRELGARVERHGRDWDDAWAVAEKHARETGALLVHPFEDPEVIAGQGTIGLELLEQLGRFDVVVVAIGGGGLVGGIAMRRQVARAVGARDRRRADRRHRHEGLDGGGAPGVAADASTPSPARWRRATSARARWRWRRASSTRWCSSATTR